MATTDELLTSTTDETEYLVIDNDLRTITIPSDITLLGVESDAKVNVLHFKMPCTYGEYDLTEFFVRINYMNANSEGDSYFADDVESDGEYMYFDWEVGRTACAYKGTTKFIVCLKLTDEDGNITREFNTTLASLTVLEGLETTAAVVSENADVIEQILAKLETFETVSTDDIATAVSEYLTENPVSAVTINQVLEDGVEIATIDGVSIYAPSYTDGDEVSY